jgi:pimeloyl-ACP methyl ester carboxylesterase
MTCRAARRTSGIFGIKRITRAADLAPAGEPGSWVSDAAREKFLAAYERAFSLWPEPREEFDVETATATTRVHAHRPHPDGDPVVLLSGAGGNAAAWYPQVAALAADGPVYGIDMPGDANPSVPRALMTPPTPCADWLDELLGKLSDRPAHLVGFSYGGWVAMNQAMRAPGRVASITLLDPAGLTKLDARFWWWLSVSGLASMSPMPLRRRFARWLDSPAMLQPELMTLMWAAIRGLSRRAEVPRRAHRRRTPRDHRAGSTDHRRAQRPAHPGRGPCPRKPHAGRGSRHRPRQSRRLQPDR